VDTVMSAPPSLRRGHLSPSHDNERYETQL
jgi:hypothetical protein